MRTNHSKIGCRVGVAVIGFCVMWGGTLIAVPNAVAKNRGGKVLLETLVVPNDKPVKVRSRTVLEVGQWYIIQARGKVSDWSDRKGGVDAVWCYHKQICGQTGKVWDQLRIDGKGMTEIKGKPIPYNAEHVYRVRYQGQGRPVQLYMIDAQSSSGDNHGSLTVRIYLKQYGNTHTASPLPHDGPRTLLETLTIPNTKSVKITSRTVLEAGQTYVIEASGIFSDWADKKGGVDSVWCYAKWRCGQNGQVWDQLRIDNKGMTELKGEPIPYNAEHVYRVRYHGHGKRVVFYLSDAQNSWSNNSGAVTVHIYRRGR